MQRAIWRKQECHLKALVVILLNRRAFVAVHQPKEPPARDKDSFDLSQRLVEIRIFKSVLRCHHVETRVGNRQFFGDDTANKIRLA